MRYQSLALAALLLGAQVSSHPNTAVAGTQLSRLAPADEYFGRLKMSILGIRNRITELESESLDPAFNNASIAWKITMVEDAIADWRTKYPADPWIARFRVRLGVVYARVGTSR